MKLIFFGTPEIAAYCLDVLHKSKHKIIAVVTAPDKPAGRGRKLRESAVKQKAKELNLRILQPKNLKDENFTKELSLLDPDLAVVVAFRMLPESVWSLPKLGTINLHASLLPDYRGAAPINWAIVNGEEYTGVTTFFINKNIDTGDIIMQKKIPIDFNDTAGTLHDKIMVEGAKLLVDTVNAIENGSVQSIPQDRIIKGKIKLAPKISKQDTKINWFDTAKNIYNFIRGMSPYPAAWTYAIVDGKKIFLKIIFVNFEEKNHNLEPATAIIENKKLKIAVIDGFIIPEKLIPEGKKMMSGRDFVNGIRNTIKFE